MSMSFMPIFVFFHRSCVSDYLVTIGTIFVSCQRSKTCHLVTESSIFLYRRRRVFYIDFSPPSPDFDDTFHSENKVRISWEKSKKCREVILTA